MLLVVVICGETAVALLTISTFSQISAFEWGLRCFFCHASQPTSDQQTRLSESQMKLNAATLS
jgi:hypothetical protein